MHFGFLDRLKAHNVPLRTVLKAAHGELKAESKVAFWLDSWYPYDFSQEAHDRMAAAIAAAETQYRQTMAEARETSTRLEQQQEYYLEETICYEFGAFISKIFNAFLDEMQPVAASRGPSAITNVRCYVKRFFTHLVIDLPLGLSDKEFLDRTLTKSWMGRPGFHRFIREVEKSVSDRLLAFFISLSDLRDTWASPAARRAWAEISVGLVFDDYSRLEDLIALTPETLYAENEGPASPAHGHAPAISNRDWFKRVQTKYRRVMGSKPTRMVLAEWAGYQAVDDVKDWLSGKPRTPTAKEKISAALTKIEHWLDAEAKKIEKMGAEWGAAPVAPIALPQKPTHNAGDDGQKQGFSTQAQTRAALTKTAGRA